MPVILALTLAAAPAAAIDRDIRCILDRIPAAARASAIQEAASGERGPMRRAIERAGEICARQRRWSMVRTSQFQRIAAAQIVADQASAQLERGGVAPALVRDWFAAQPPEIRRNTIGNRPAADSLAAHLARAGVSSEAMRANGLTIGTLIGALGLIESGRAELSD